MAHLNLHQHAQHMVEMTEVFLAKDNLANSWSIFEDDMAQLNQSMVALTALLLGTLLAARGFAIMKPTFVLSTALALGTRTFSVACREGQLIPGVISALVVFACGVIFAHRLYPIFVFACGAVMAGVATFVFRAVLDLMDSPTALISLMMMVSVFGGLLLQQSRMFSYRILTPILGGLLMAASIRFFSIDAFTKASVTWLSFTHFSLRPAYVVTDPLEVFFVVTWGVCTCLGWYSQLISVLAGVDPLQLPEHFSLQLQRLNKWFPWIFDGGEEFASDILPSLRQEREPFLPKEGENQSSVDERPDYRPECLILMMVFSVLMLNFLMMSKPLLFLGHVVMMSAAFQVFMTASLTSYISPKRVMLGLKGSSPLLRHFTHGSFNVLVLFFAIGGYLSMYARQVEHEESQWGLSNASVTRITHVWTGYATLALLFIMCFSGAIKMFAGLTSGSSDDVAKFHSHLGRSLYGFAGVNQLSAYFMPGLLPLWASLLLSVLLLVTTAATLYFLITRDADTVQRMKRFRDQGQETQDLPVLLNSTANYAPVPKISTSCSSNTTRLESLKSLANSSHRSSGGALSIPPSRRVSDWDPVMATLEAQEAKVLLTRIFLDWHRQSQATRISKAQAELRGSNNLVDFLSSALVAHPQAEEAEP